MKDTKKTSILSGVAGATVGVAGTMGASELRDYLNEQETETKNNDNENNNGQGNNNEEEQTTHNTVHHTSHDTQHVDTDEIVPVGSDMEMVSVDVDTDIQDVIDVDPDEIAELIIAEDVADDDSSLLALNDEKDDEDAEIEDFDDEDDDIEDDGDNDDFADDDDIMDDIEDCLA